MRLIFLDESGANLSLCREYARSFDGERIKHGCPHPRGNKFNILSAIDLSGVKASMYGKWSVDGDIFLTFIEKQLCPKLKQGDIVVLDNINFHYMEKVKIAIESKDAKLIYLPAYSPDFSPIENMWSKVKAILRKYAPRIERQFNKAIKIAFKSISNSDIAGWFKHCGYRV